MYVHYLCCCLGLGAYYCPERLMRYRVHSQSDTSSYSPKDIETNIRKEKNHIFCYERFLEDERIAELKPSIKKAWASAMTSVGINLLRAKQPAEARAYLLKALEQSPSFRALAALILSFNPKSFASRF